MMKIIINSKNFKYIYNKPNYNRRNNKLKVYKIVKLNLIVMINKQTHNNIKTKLLIKKSNR